ncbi:NUDIX hydrolase [Aquimarina agarivorans]|uniref:NUDIX hydrolase n=1 Tax=Aquimarina agarivorans TaxID=980584 RepID=UPI000248FD7C|nr:NUDIX domain-containing protein [Aquimarina agarivorans]
MYKVFVNNSVIILSTESWISDEHIKVNIKKANMTKIINELLMYPSIKYHLYHKKEDKLFKILHKKLPVVAAGGGKVYNAQKEILFIHRNGKWDLPKGKAEKNESISQTALREVEEETGIENLILGDFIRKTYHVYRRNNVFKLKLTYWFEMYSDFKGELLPQEDEGITKVRWKSFKKSKKALENTYGAIKELFPMEYFD